MPPPEVVIPTAETDPVHGPEVDETSSPEADTHETGDVTQAVVPAEAMATDVPPEQAAELVRRIEQMAGALAETPRKRVTWLQDGRKYSAELVLEPARNGVEPDRAVAQVSSEDQGRRLHTLIRLRRLPFSHFAQLVDRWDPMVQLHDDEIVGRMHVNSRFNVLYDSQASPRLLGKVTTAASGFTMKRSGRWRDADAFPQGIETGTGRIAFSEAGSSIDWTGLRGLGRIHELERETWIRFLANDRYSWRVGRSGRWQHAESRAGRAVYFMAERAAVVHVQGVVSGRFLVYSPRRIVVEGDITYARDPRSDPASEDFLGLVSDRDIEVAPPEVTGPGDLSIHAALFAGRRLLVKDAVHHAAATLNIFGSLAAGTLSESEPRYATRIEHDDRFERLRPPGFPSTNRCVTEEWDRQWNEAPEGSIQAGS